MERSLSVRLQKTAEFVEAGDVISYNSISVTGLYDEKYLCDPKNSLV
jgi:hypothetical protein